MVNYLNINYLVYILLICRQINTKLNVLGNKEPLLGSTGFTLKNVYLKMCSLILSYHK